MRGDIVYRVYGQHDGREKDVYFGAFRTVPEAEAKIAQLHTTEMHGENRAAKHHNRGFVVRPVAVETDFEIPPRPTPRERYFVIGTPRPNAPGTWDSTTVEVFRRTPGGREKVAEYLRHYSLLQTFEPFRQGDREFALTSMDYTRTAVLDLATGKVIAEEPETEGGGFCPVGFYVPDWWDVHDDSIIPGSEYWAPHREGPTGEFGFVWGCIWGDDSSWKVQYLDLSRVRDGEVKRDERFGYVELATNGHVSPCFRPDADPPPKSAPPFIRVGAQVTFSVEMAFDLASGKCVDWQRLRVEDHE